MQRDGSSEFGSGSPGGAGTATAGQASEHSSIKSRAKSLLRLKMRSVKLSLFRIRFLASPAVPITLVEFSWQGKDERDDAYGRGWAVIEDDGTLAGRVYFHQGDDSAFTATRTDGGRHAARRPTARLRKL